MGIMIKDPPDEKGHSSGNVTFHEKGGGDFTIEIRYEVDQCLASVTYAETTFNQAYSNEVGVQVIEHFLHKFPSIDERTPEKCAGFHEKINHIMRKQIKHERAHRRKAVAFEEHVHEVEELERSDLDLEKQHQDEAKAINQETEAMEEAEKGLEDA